jgi:hypothetical protein
MQAGREFRANFSVRQAEQPEVATGKARVVGILALFEVDR